MGWFPARDKNNKVPPENLNFPQAAKVEGNVIRAMQWGTGKNKNAGDRNRRSMGKLLAENAIAKGWLNGKPIGKQKRT